MFTIHILCEFQWGHPQHGCHHTNESQHMVPSAHTSASQRHLYLFSHFCSAYPCAQHTDTQTMLHVTYCVLAIRSNNNINTTRLFIWRRVVWESVQGCLLFSCQMWVNWRHRWIWFYVKRVQPVLRWNTLVWITLVGLQRLWMTGILSCHLSQRFSHRVQCLSWQSLPVSNAPCSVSVFFVTFCLWGIFRISTWVKAWNEWPKATRFEVRKVESCGWVLGESASSSSAKGSGEYCKLPQWGPGRSPDRQAVLLHLKYSGRPLLTLQWCYCSWRQKVTGMLLTVAKNCLPQTRPIVLFSSALYKTELCPISIDFARVTCIRFC